MRITKSLNYLVLFPVIAITCLLMSSEWLVSKPIVASVPPPLQAGFEQNPPYPVKFWVQKLATASRNGENLIFKVKYEYDGTLPTTIDLYGNAISVQYVLKDDGVYPDDIARDGKYACLKKEDITNLLSEISAMESKINARGYVTHFRGHSGQVTSAANLVPFDFTKFQNNNEVEVNALLIDAELCSDQIKVEKSLFITDLSVVEDQSRTYNVATGIGNANGAWTFGTLMGNMENGQHTDGIRGFFKRWIKQWTNDQTVNGQLVIARQNVIECMIQPWLRKAQGNSSLTVTLQNWESLWDATNSNALKQNAPFKLTTIVNRIDLQGNSAYSGGLQNSGETRFIFSLINPYTGQIPISPDQPLAIQLDGIGLGDWRGLNVILEYGNTQTSKCDVLNLAQQWLDLSDNAYSFGNAATNNSYKNALQQITDYVTAANSNTGKPNSSAINRIRTNEKAFSNRDPNLEVHLAWSRMDWEFRQFELDPSTHGFKMVPLTNTPPVTSNAASNIEEDFSGTSQTVINDNLLSWIYGGNKLNVRNGNYNMPSYLLSGSSLVTSEGAHYFDFNRENWVTKSPNYNASLSSNEAKEIRQQFSLNTCIGCHNGETKSRFTHINTLAYNESARYWFAALDGNSLIQDNRSYPFGTGLNEISGHSIGMTVDANFVDFDNYTVAIEFNKQNFFQAVSPFLTGRRYRTFTSEDGRTPTWQDDERDDLNSFPNNFELSDQNMEGLFYVGDPSNTGASGGFPFLNDKKWGYNDLLRRKNGLCAFLINGCNGVIGQQNNPSSMSLIRSIACVPLPLASH